MPDPKAKIIATIDIGSNSIVLLMASCTLGEKIEFLDEYYSLTKLGAEVKSKKLLSDAAVDRTIETVKELKERAVSEGAEQIIITTSSAVRMADNRNRFLVKCYKELNIFPQVLSGNDEAKYTYLGAITDLNVDPDRPIVTIDVGGGSTEITWGTINKMVEGHSLDIGCVNLNEEFKLGENYYLYKRIAAERYVRKEFATIANSLTSWLQGAHPKVVITGGTATTYAGILTKKDIYERNHINLLKGYRKEMSAISRKLAKMDIKSRRRVPGIMQDRVYEMPAGLLILTEFLRYFHFKRFVISSYGLRAGILKHYAEKYGC